jgi:hypothetical protein
MGSGGYAAAAQVRGTSTAELDGIGVVFFVNWEGWYVMNGVLGWLIEVLLTACRIELDGSNYEFFGFYVYGVGGVVG